MLVFDYADPEDDGSKLLQNFPHYAPTDTATYPRRRVSLIKVMLQVQGETHWTLLSINTPWNRENIHTYKHRNVQLSFHLQLSMYFCSFAYVTVPCIQIHESKLTPRY
jgi:hypothetical protein